MNLDLSDDNEGACVCGESASPICPQHGHNVARCDALKVAKTNPRVKTFEAEGYITGDYECFCIADAPSPRDQNEDLRVYPDRWFEHLDHAKKYKFRITVEAHEIG